MKTIALIIAMIVSNICFSQNLTVKVDNVLSEEGNIIVALHSEETFMKSQQLQFHSVKANKEGIEVTFENVEPGIYAVMVLHDQNENGRMDYHASGMPKEYYGISNNPMSFGPPNFNDAKFELSDQDKSITIRF